jgi:hypothetical protein
MPSIDIRETNAEIAQLHPMGVVRFPKLTQPAGPNEYNPGKYTVTVLLPKGDEHNDAYAEIVNAAHQGVGGTGEVVKDGDTYKPDFNSGHWVVLLKANGNRRPRVVDSEANPIDPQEVEQNDLVRFGSSLFDYSAMQGGRLKGCSIYLNWLQLARKGQAPIPKFEGGFVATKPPLRNEAGEGYFLVPPGATAANMPRQEVEPEPEHDDTPDVVGEAAHAASPTAPLGYAQQAPSAESVATGIEALKAHARGMSPRAAEVLAKVRRTNTATA